MVTSQPSWMTGKVLDFEVEEYESFSCSEGGRLPKIPPVSEKIHWFEICLLSPLPYYCISSNRFGGEHLKKYVGRLTIQKRANIQKG